MSPNHSTRPFEWNKDLWFDDGDIRVCARRFDTGALCLYSLYRDMLAAHSTTLINLLEKCLACRHIHVGSTPYAYLPDDDALDLERFFIAIFYPTYCFFWKPNARSFRRTLPVFRIALKYGASGVIEALATQLEQDWPLTIAEWDGAQCEDGPFVEPLRDPCSEGQTLNRAATTAVTEPASAIQVARIANLPNVLYAAYYQLSRISGADVSHVGATKDRNREKHGSVRHRGRGKGDGQMPLLSKDDVRRLAFGKEQLARYMLAFKKRLPQALVLHPKCADAWHMCVAVTSDDPLADLLELCSAEVFPGGNTVCSGCRSLINKRGREERERIWASLPQLFCFPVHLGTS